MKSGEKAKEMQSDKKDNFGQKLGCQRVWSSRELGVAVTRRQTSSRCDANPERGLQVRPTSLES